MPTNLNNFIEIDTATTNSANSSTNAQSSSNDNTSSVGNNPLISCSDVPVAFRPQLPTLATSNKMNNGSNKAHLARQVTNVIKRHNIEARQQITDKII